MKYLVFVIRDGAMADYGRPVFLQSAGHALRMFGDEVNRADKDNPMYMHPEDFELFSLGEFESSTGIFSTREPESVARAINLVMKKQ